MVPLDLSIQADMGDIRGNNMIFKTEREIFEWQEEVEHKNLFHSEQMNSFYDSGVSLTTFLTQWEGMHVG